MANAAKMETDKRTGRFVASAGLTDNQLSFVENYVSSGGLGSKSAEMAGYANPRTDSWHLLQLPHVKSAIAERLDAELRSMHPVALGTMKRLMTDEETPSHVKFQAARWTLEACGVVKPVAVLGLPGSEKALGDMSVEELRRFVDQGKAALSALPTMKAIEVKAEVSA